MRLVCLSLMVLILGVTAVWAAEPEGAPKGASDAEAPPVEVPKSEVQPKNNVPPRYPATAKSRNLEGACKLRVFIDETGRPYEVEVLACPTLFIVASVDAALASRFQPTLVGGEAKKAAFVYNYLFRLGGSTGPPALPEPLSPPLVFRPAPPEPKGRFREVQLAELDCAQRAEVTYPEWAQALGWKASCQVMLYFDAQGEVIHTEALDCGEPFISAVRSPAAPFVCSPYERRGEAVPVKTEYTVFFEPR